MAKLSADKKSVIVEKGDSLTQIAVDYAGGYSKYKQLAAINNITNPDRVCIGQTIKLTKEATSHDTKSSNSNKPTIIQFGLISNVDNTLFATWSWSKSNTESYKVVWTYSTGQGVWFNGSSSTITVDKDDPSLSRQSTYSIPSNATMVRFKVKPISETYKKNDVDTNYWEASWSDVETWAVILPLGVPSAPSVEIDKFTLKASLENIDMDDANQIEFEMVRTYPSPYGQYRKKVAILFSSASATFNVTAGCEYKVRCRSHSIDYGTYSEWSDYSNIVKTIPSPPESIISIEAISEKSVQIYWTHVPNATEYTIEYTIDERFFDSNTGVNSVTKTATDGPDMYASIYIDGLDPGRRYYFRIKAKNSEGESSWSEIKSIVIGKPPAAPTTWSSTTTAYVGEQVILYWVHNSEDGSKQESAHLKIYNGDTCIIDEKIHITYGADDSENKTRQWVLDTSEYTEGVSLTWSVSTAGATGEFGDWSIERSIDIYAPATLELSMTNSDDQQIEILRSYPFYISALAGPNTQKPIGYHLSIKSNQIYDTIDSIGNQRTVNKDEEVYSKFFVTDKPDKPLLVELTPGNVNLVNGIEYTVTCIVSMNSGLTAESSLAFMVGWEDNEEYAPNAEIGIDEDTITTNIRPYCEDIKIINYQVLLQSGKYVKTTTEVASVFGRPFRGIKTTTGEKVYYGTTDDGEDIYYCIVEEKTTIYDAILSVYRREFDGSFTELATKIDSAKAVTITDPHPSLDYARYRIVATNKQNGAISYYDPPAYPVGCKSVIIQWDEDWKSFETSEETSMEQPPWSGSMLKLPYNIDVSDSNKPDTSLIEYAGRTHPVSYYGTQLGVTSTWSLVIPKDDKDTLYGLRRLSRWMGDVYVREPSGSGYWANITVSFSQKHCEVIIPVTLNISQVEGGM